MDTHSKFDDAVKYVMDQQTLIANIKDIVPKVPEIFDPDDEAPFKKEADNLFNQMDAMVAREFPSMPIGTIVRVRWKVMEKLFNYK